MLKTEITFERILGTFAPGALFIFGVWYLHRPFFLKYFPNLVGGLIEKGSSGASELETVGSVSVGAKLIMFILVSFCIGIVVNQMTDIGISFLFIDNANEKSASRFKRIAKRIVRTITLTQFREDPRICAVAEFIRSVRKPYFLKMVKKWTKADADVLSKFDTKTNEASARLQTEAILVHQHLMARLEVIPGTSRKIYDEENFSLNFIGSLMVTFILLLPVAISSFSTSNWTAAEVKVHYNTTIWGLTLLVFIGIGICGLLLKRQFKKLCRHLLTTSFHLYLIENEASKAEKIISTDERVNLEKTEVEL